MLLPLLLACATVSDSADTASEDTSPPAPTTASVELAFVMDFDLVAEMAEPPVGVFRGSIFAEDDATGFGPNEDAVALLDFESDPIDLTATGGPSAVAYVGGELEPGIVWILGCLDTAGDDCECGDPITHPNDNKLEIVVGANPLEVTMELLHPC